MALVTQRVKDCVCVPHKEKCAYKRHEIMQEKKV